MRGAIPGESIRPGNGRRDQQVRQAVAWVERGAWRDTDLVSAWNRGRCWDALSVGVEHELGEKGKNFIILDDVIPRILPWALPLKRRLAF